MKTKGSKAGQKGESRQQETNKDEVEPAKKHRTQKEVLNCIRTRNKKQKGPFLRRPDSMHIKVVNVYKSMGFDMQMVNLAGIDNMMTNFNQIVIQEGIINKYYFSFDLPVH